MFSSRNLRKLAIVSTALIGVFGIADAASAATTAQTHSRRAEVVRRLDQQSVRIAKAEAAGKLSPTEAARLHRKDARIHREERKMAALHHGRITKAEKRTLDREESAVGKQIP